MRIEDLLSTTVASIIAGLVTLFAAVISQRIAARQRRAAEKHREEVEQIAGVVQTEEAARKAAVLERVVERIPVGLTTEQFGALVGEITTRLQAMPAPPAAGSAVENLINNYHEQALSQARAQFWFSVAAATVGFVWILVAGSTITAENVATTMKVLPGVVIDAVAFLFFRQASETRQRATELYDRLRRDKQMTESAALVSSIEDLRLRSAVKAQVALHMSGLEPRAIDLSTFLSLDPHGVDRERDGGGRATPNSPLQPTAAAEDSASPEAPVVARGG